MLYRTCLSLIIVLASVYTLLSQMPEWKFFRDREGNRYYIDNTGGIRITSVSDYIFRPVSADGIDFYINFAAELESRRKYESALTLYKSILALPETDNRVRQARILASKRVNSMKKTFGDRYIKLNDDASLLSLRQEGSTRIINDRMLYSMFAPGNVKLTRKRIRDDKDERYYGITLGINFNKKYIDNKLFDAIVAIDAVSKKSKILGLDELVNEWKMIFGTDPLVREELARTGEKIIYSFRDSGEKQVYSGYEVQQFNGNFMYIVRVAASSAVFKANEQALRSIAESFTVVPSGRVN